MNRSSNTHKTR